MDKLKFGDYVFCTETGVRGRIVKFYKPTGGEKQILVNTDDGMGQYHAPARLWKLYSTNYLIGKTAAHIVIDEYVSADIESCQSLLNAHGHYVYTFAKNHGMSIDEAYQHPTVKAHLAFYNAMLDNKKKLKEGC